MRGWRPWWGILAVAALAVLLLGVPSGAPAASTELARFSTPGTYSWTVPSGVRKVTFDVFGASGGNHADGHDTTAFGGAGGGARGQFAVKPGLRRVISRRGGEAS